MTSRTVRSNRAMYDRLVRSVTREWARSPDDAIGTLGIATTFAASNYIGALCDPDAEEQLGRARLGDSTTTRKSAPSSVLHVASALHETGGHTRLLQRWITLDDDHTPSVFLTRASADSVPERVREVVSSRGGTVATATGAGMLARASELRGQALGHRYVVLHIHPGDLIPALAFGPDYDGPPVLLVDHADHLFWIAPPATALLVSLRAAGERLARTYRRIGSDRIGRLTIPLEPVDAVPDRQRTAAKAAVGLPENACLVLTCAAPYKFRGRAGGLPGFLDIVTPVVARDPRVHLIAIGPDPGERAWRAAAKRTNGRIRATGVLADTTGYRLAADVYADSFPFASNTSLLESAARGTAALGMHLADPDLEVFGPGDPRLEGVLPRASSPSGYADLLTRLLADDPFRTATGEALRDAFARDADGMAWAADVANVYRAADAAPGPPFRAPGAAPLTPPAFDRMLSDLLKHYRPGLWAPLAQGGFLLTVPRQRAIRRAERVVAAARKAGAGRRHADALGTLAWSLLK